MIMIIMMMMGMAMGTGEIRNLEVTHTQPWRQRKEEKIDKIIQERERGDKNIILLIVVRRQTDIDFCCLFWLGTLSLFSLLVHHQKSFLVLSFLKIDVDTSAFKHYHFYLTPNKTSCHDLTLLRLDRTGRSLWVWKTSRRLDLIPAESLKSTIK